MIDKQTISYLNAIGNILKTHSEEFDNRVATFFTGLNEEVKKFPPKSKQTELKPTKSLDVFSYIFCNKGKDEVRLSFIIADLLNPNGSHKCGNLFLNEFLKVIKQEQFLSLTESVANVSPNIQNPSEQSTEERKKIDIVIEFQNKTCIAIENKPYRDSTDSENQVSDYIKDLTMEKKYNVFFIYLSYDGSSPSDISISTKERQDLVSENKFISISYQKHIIEWLERCWENCENGEEVKNFLANFYNFIFNNFIKGQSMLSQEEKNTIAEYSTKSLENLKAAIAVYESFDEIRKEMIYKFFDRLEKEIYKTFGTGWKIHNGIKRSFSNSDISFFITKETWDSKVKLCFEPDNKNLYNFFIGVKKTEGEFNTWPLKDILDKKLFLQPKNENPLWIWWKYLDEPYRNFTEPELLLAIFQEDFTHTKAIIDLMLSLKDIAEPSITDLLEMKNKKK